MTIPLVPKMPKRQGDDVNCRPPFFKNDKKWKNKREITSKNNEKEKWRQKMKIEKKGNKCHFSLIKTQFSNNSNKEKKAYKSL